MKVSEASWSATPCAASGTSPTQPTIMARAGEEPDLGQELPADGPAQAEDADPAPTSRAPERWRRRYSGSRRARRRRRPSAPPVLVRSAAQAAPSIPISGAPQAPKISA